MQTEEDSTIEQNLIKGEEVKGKRPHYVFDNLTNVNIWGYAVGHIFNDLCAASWFNFLLFYLTKVLNFEAGSYSMLAGQIADALGTPSAGILSDKYNTRFGKRIPWYFLSFILVLLTFLPMWCYPIMNSFLPLDNNSFRTFFFIFIPSAFNYFWAFGYIAHISLVPSLTCSRVRRDILNTRRNTFTFFANMLLLLLALFVFSVIDDSEQQFQAIGIICSAIGTAFCLIFLFTVKEVPLTISCNEAVKNLKAVLKEKEGKQRQSLLLEEDQDSLQPSSIQKNNINEASDKEMNSNIHITNKDQSSKEGSQQSKDYVFSGADQIFEADEDIKNPNQELRISTAQRQNRENSLVEKVHHWKDWFREIQFYQYAFVFMFARLFCNVTTTMMNFYLYYVIRIGGENDSDDSEVKLTFQLALIPLLLYISSVGASSILNLLYQKIGRKKTFTLGVFLMVVSIVPLSFLTADNKFLQSLIYPLAMILGASQALQLNTAINLISEVIGLRGAGGAFVFGCYSFLDKMMTGIVLFAITESNPYKENDPEFIRLVMVIIPAVASVGAWVLILLGQAKDYDKNSKKVAKMSRMSLGDEFVT